MYRYQGGNSVLLWPPLRTNSCSTILVASCHQRLPGVPPLLFPGGFCASWGGCHFAAAVRALRRSMVRRARLLM